MKRTSLAVALFGAVSLFGMTGEADADQVTHFDWTREQLREYCQAHHGELRETHSKTICVLVDNTQIVCKNYGGCTRRRYIWGVTGGSSLTESSDSTPPVEGGTVIIGTGTYGSDSGPFL